MVAELLCIAPLLRKWRLRHGMVPLVDEDGQRQVDAIHIVASARLVAEVEQLG